MDVRKCDKCGLKFDVEVGPHECPPKEAPKVAEVKPSEKVGKKP